MAKKIALETMWKAKQMYEERWSEEEGQKFHQRVGERKWSQMQIAAHLGISETSVLRAIHNYGRFANRNNDPLPMPKSDAMLQMGAEASLKKVLDAMAVEKAEQTPGQTKADKMLAEIDARTDLSDEAKAKLKDYL